MLVLQSYNAAKAATISLTEQLAVELKNPGLEVRVNTLAPGYFPSEVSKEYGSILSPFPYACKSIRKPILIYSFASS